MKREYAVEDENGILFSTPGFDPANITEKASFQSGKTLLICDPNTDQVALLERLREAEEMISAKESFLSNMSHDMRTPMNAIIGMTVLAKKHIDEQARVSDALDKIETASNHLLSLINNVLDMSRINSGKLQLSDESFALGDLLHDILVIVKPLIEQKGHRFLLDTDGVECEVYFGDALRLKQIFVNIISNAVKYTPEGGKIDVSVSDTATDGGRRVLLFRCADNGIGMSAEFLKRIFVPFERVENSTVSKIEGTGLGMSIVKKMIDLMGGTIEIQSQPGEGTDVSIRIPLRPDKSEEENTKLAGKKLLVMEADEKLCETYRRFFDDYKVNCTLVPTTADAFSVLADANIRNEVFDAVILGQRIDNDQMEIASYLHKSWPTVPLILISDDNWAEIRYRAERCGIEHFVPLPVFRYSLAKGISAAIRTGEEDSGAAGYPDLNGRRILLAEDNFINREIALEILSITGAEVVPAENGEEAVRLFESEPEQAFSMVLMDVQMPIMDGYEATRRIRASEKAYGASIPIYAMTANTFAEDIARARKAGMNGHLAKPIDVNALMQVLQQIRV